MEITKEEFMEALQDVLLNYAIVKEQLGPDVNKIIPTSYYPPKKEDEKLIEERKYHFSIYLFKNDRIKELNKKEFAEAKKQDEINFKKKVEEEKMKIIEEEKVKKLEEEKVRLKEEEMKKIKELILPEPEKNNPNTCEIVFRLPSGKRITRLFLKTYKIEVYNVFNAIVEFICFFELFRGMWFFEI